MHACSILNLTLTHHHSKCMLAEWMANLDKSDPGGIQYIVPTDYYMYMYMYMYMYIHV